MLSLQKSASDRTGLGYDFSSPNIATSSTTVFVSPANNICWVLDPLKQLD